MHSAPPARSDRPRRRPGSLLPNPPRSLTFLRTGYGWGPFTQDLLAGLTVGIVAVPLAMAFAIASGLPPERGLYTAVVAGFLISLLSGSRVQIGGPTGAFVVIVFGIAARHGYEGLQIATLLAAGMLILMGLFRMGAMIRYIPYPVVTGFTTGIALVILSTQMRDLFGLRIERLPAEFVAQWEVYARSAASWNPWALAVGGGTVALIVGLRRLRPRIPGPIVALALASLAVWAFHLPVETIGTRFGGIPSSLPLPSLPPFDPEKWRALVPEAFTIAILAAIESLLCAVVADGMIGDRHDSNTELIGQGLANIGSALFGGLPATGALARTATNIKSGGRSPVAGLVHALTLLAIMALAAPLAVHVPLACLAGILVIVAWNMSELDHFRAMFRAPRSDALTMVVTFVLTVAVDLTLAVQVGIVLAALLFMRRMTEVTQVAALRASDGGAIAESPDDDDRDKLSELPPQVEVYEINGPFFFGVADRLKDVLAELEAPPQVFILRLRRVPAIDATGLEALAEFYEKCRRQGSTLVLSGVNPQPQRALERSGLLTRIGAQHVHPHIDAALAHARALLGARPGQDAAD
jgi:SulP family sulfate permease